MRSQMQFLMVLAETREHTSVSYSPGKQQTHDASSSHLLLPHNKAQHTDSLMPRTTSQNYSASYAHTTLDGGGVGDATSKSLAFQAVSMLSSDASQSLSNLPLGTWFYSS